MNESDADDWRALVKWACHYHALMLAHGQGLQYDDEGDEDKWQGLLGTASPVKTMTVWTSSSGYVISCVDYDPRGFIAPGALNPSCGLSLWAGIL